MRLFVFNNKFYIFYMFALFTIESSFLGEAQGPFRMGPHRTETRLLRKLLRATSLCFRHKRPKSRGVYVPLTPPLRYTLQAAP